MTRRLQRLDGVPHKHVMFSSERKLSLIFKHLKAIKVE
jgi:hypothetical protein